MAKDELLMVERLLQGRWTTSDNESAIFFQFVEETDSWGWMNVEEAGSPTKDFEFKLAIENDNKIIRYREKDQSGERKFLIEIISLSTLILKRNDKRLTLKKG